MEIYGKRLVKGILYTGISLYAICHEFGTNWLGSNNKWKDSISRWAENQPDFISWMSSLFVFLMTFIALALLAKGIYYLCSMHLEKVPAVDTPWSVKFAKPCGNSDDEGDNIEKFQKFRDSKLSTMTNSEAAEEYKKTAWVDSLSSDNGKHTQSVKRYINSKLSAKTNEQGYNWLKR
jgi:hypothetical protein